LEKWRSEEGEEWRGEGVLAGGMKRGRNYEEKWEE
jgi:hypothetical protein